MSTAEERMKDEALKLALEALDNDSDSDDAWHQRLDAKTAIKEALAAPAAQPAPVQPVALLNGIERYEPEIFREDRIRMELDKTGEWVKYADVVTLLSTPPAAPVQEPAIYSKCAMPEVCPDHAHELYSTPPAAQPALKPLTDEQIKQLAERHLDVGDGTRGTHYVYGEIEFVRAIEAAHGIKEKNT